MRNQSSPKPRSLLGKIALGLIGLIALCCVITIVISIFPLRGRAPSASRPVAQSVAVTIHAPAQAGQQSSQADAAPAPTEQPTRQPTPTPIPPTLPPAGSSRDNPAPVGVPVEIGEFVVVVNEVVRPADQIVAAGNMFNSEPEAGEEYVKVVVSITCAAILNDKCSVSPFNFEMYGSRGIIHKAEFMLAGIDGMLESTEMLKGAILENKSLFFLAGADETNLVMEFDAGVIFRFRASAYFAIPD